MYAVRMATYPRCVRVVAQNSEVRGSPPVFPGAAVSTSRLNQSGHGRSPINVQHYAFARRSTGQTIR